MDEIHTRLRDTSQTCLKAYEEWAGKKKDQKAQEVLHSAIHELRKVSSRLEIELAVNERDQMTSRPLPIPSHRANKGGQQGEDFGNEDEQQQQPRRQPMTASAAQGMKRRRPLNKPNEEGNGNGNVGNVGNVNVARPAASPEPEVDGA